eukprot:gene3495-463_t
MQLARWGFLGRGSEENLEWLHHRLELIMLKMTYRQGHLRQGDEDEDEDEAGEGDVLPQAEREAEAIEQLLADGGMLEGEPDVDDDVWPALGVDRFQ